MLVNNWSQQRGRVISEWPAINGTSTLLSPRPRKHGMSGRGSVGDRGMGEVMGNPVSGHDVVMNSQQL